MQDMSGPLAAIVGTEYVRGLGGAVAVAPGNAEEIAAVLRLAQENHLAVVECGGGTKQGWGYPVAPALVLEMHRLNTLREHTWQDMTCTVEAGCTWAAMQSGLAQHGQFVAVDPLWPDKATVGGIVATNDSGTLRQRYGGLRDLVIGMTIVLADGTIAHTGGKVVKNVAGYDLHKLMIGAFGTLGVVTSVNFRLHSIPRCAQSFTVSATSVEPVGRVMLAMLHAQLSTVAIQLRGGVDGFDLDIQLASLPEVLETQAGALGYWRKARALGCGPLRMRYGMRGSGSSTRMWFAKGRCFRRRLLGLLKGFGG
jgi:glycolate oxidase FAD binding subunit